MRRALVVLAVAALLAISWLALPGTNALAGAGLPELHDRAGPEQAPAQVTCNSCADCTSKLASGSYITVTLSTDLLNLTGSCISLLLAESDVRADAAVEIVLGVSLETCREVRGDLLDGVQHLAADLQMKPDAPG